jgi:hypothetical protein
MKVRRESKSRLRKRVGDRKIFNHLPQIRSYNVPTESFAVDGVAVKFSWRV